MPRDAAIPPSSPLAVNPPVGNVPSLLLQVHSAYKDIIADLCLKVVLAQC